MRHRVPAWVVPTVVTLAAAVLLFVRLGQPDGIVLDEVYYVEDARNLLDGGVERGFTVHPPVGKWWIATGIALLGDTPAGWRAGGALAGSLTVLLTVLLTRRLTGRAGLGALAGGLLALDGMFLVQARTAMLDIYLTGFVVLGAYLLVVDRQRPRTGTIQQRWPLGLAGVAFGAAVATKWSGVLALLAAAGLVVVWEFAARRRPVEPPHPAGPPPPVRGRTPLPVPEASPVTSAPRGRAASATAAVLVLGLVGPALVTYLVTWTPWLVQFERTRTAEVLCAEEGEAQTSERCPSGPAPRARGLVRHHADVARFHLELDAEHPYRAPATTWPVQARPVVFHWETCGRDDDPATCGVAPGNAAEVVGLGNLALWWGGLALLPVLVAGAVRRDRRSGVPLAFLAAQYLPWLVVARPVFSFYAVPLVPFLAAGVAVACGELDRPRRSLLTVSGTVVGAAAGALAAALVGAGPSGVGTAAGVAGLTGTALGAAADGRYPLPSDREAATPVGTLVAVVLAVLAVAAAVYFAPIWLAMELPEEALRRRWWFPGWV
jgi:dolichyl-phosphate-mannose-protein mannosyltransferase